MLHSERDRIAQMLTKCNHYIESTATLKQPAPVRDPDFALSSKELSRWVELKLLLSFISRLFANLQANAARPTKKEARIRPKDQNYVWLRSVSKLAKLASNDRAASQPASQGQEGTRRAWSMADLVRRTLLATFSPEANKEAELNGPKSGPSCGPLNGKAADLSGDLTRANGLLLRAELV